ncbi:hypothetical protein BDC45DRAFT_574783 [Circinella umbellata]|nr:hypothetical protein BDC45DRAFT_574783 [Circinella umbellata]
MSRVKEYSKTTLPELERMKKPQADQYLVWYFSSIQQKVSSTESKMGTYSYGLFASTDTPLAAGIGGVLKTHWSTNSALDAYNFGRLIDHHPIEQPLLARKLSTTEEIESEKIGRRLDTIYIGSGVLEAGNSQRFIDADVPGGHRARIMRTDE